MLGNSVTIEKLTAIRVDITAGGWHSTALTDEGEVYGWGRGENGRLGFGDSDKSSKMVPQKVQLLAGEDIVQVHRIDGMQ
ncbi:ultraviolet-B receptor UVR8-like isoform X2 [Cajanus cajan]|uniref:ultraviolet-B receptor UVR8-like isoform X2 n=1 Tax=Cajanus cajan TaxID=3821 RepID=UPI00098D9675|nr:ultraviolet-B receptor UVR8-like isoform X2 [Cajanus cajan]